MVIPVLYCLFLGVWVYRQVVGLPYKQILSSKEEYNKMIHGRYLDQRVYTHFVHTYSRVPYLDREIFNVGTDSLRLSRRADQRAAQANSGIEKVVQQSQELTNSLRQSRRKREEDAAKFIGDLKTAQEAGLVKEQLAWSKYQQDREDSKLNRFKDERYLEEILKSNSTKAESRLTSVRRWN